MKFCERLTFEISLVLCIRIFLACEFSLRFVYDIFQLLVFTDNLYTHEGHSINKMNFEIKRILFLPGKNVLYSQVKKKVSFLFSYY